MALASPSFASPSVPGADLVPLSFAEIEGWASAPKAAAFGVFRAGCRAPEPLRRGAATPEALSDICRAADAAGPLDEAGAQAFLEAHFQPLAIRLQAGARGFLTGYYEPEFPASLTAAPGFPTPLYARPPDLVTRNAEAPEPDWPQGLEAARRLADGRLVPFPARAEIDAGALGSAPEIVAWLADPVDRFVMQVQGSARLRLTDGSVLRVAYAGRNGHPYVSLGRLMVQRLGIPPAEMTMDRLVARLKSDPEANRNWIHENPSFVFFRAATELARDKGPIGGAGLPLTDALSLAVDRAIWPYGLPFWLSGELPTRERGAEPLRRLTIAQDTGSAIVGAARFDLFWGSGAEAGFLAGLTRHPVDAVVLWPRAAQAPR